MHLYIDDSGTRNPDRNPQRASHGYDWFSLGGVLLKSTDEPLIRAEHANLMARWELDPDVCFLHSAEIRQRTGGFTWLAGCGREKQQAFLADLYGFMKSAPVLGFACVIDRPGYNQRYRERYGRQQWSLCKTAFAVVVERAAKYAVANGCKLRVFVEKSDRNTDGWMKGYYEHLRETGMPFDAGNMGRYGPLSPGDLKATLYEFRAKGKTSPPMQLADLYLWPMSVGGYDAAARTYAQLMQDGKLIDCHLTADELPILGIKYSCWENVTRRV